MGWNNLPEDLKNLLARASELYPDRSGIDKFLAGDKVRLLIQRGNLPAGTAGIVHAVESSGSMFEKGRFFQVMFYLGDGRVWLHFRPDELEMVEAAKYKE